MAHTQTDSTDKEFDPGTILDKDGRPIKLDLQREYGFDDSGFLSLFKDHALTYENPDELIGKKGYEIYDKMYRHSEIKGAIEEKKGKILATAWHVAPASDDPLHIEQAEEIEYQLKHVDGGIKSGLEAMLDGLVKGFSINEKIFTIVQGGPRKGITQLSRLKSKRPDNYGFELDKFSNIIALVNESVEGTAQSFMGGSGERVPLAKFVHFSHKGRYENPYGESDLRAAYQWYWLKDTYIKFQAIFLETMGMPTRVAHYPQGFAQASQNALQGLMEAIKSNTAITIQDDIKLDFMEAGKQNADAFQMAIEYADKQINRAVIGQFMTSSIDAAGGARAAAEVHQETAEDFVSGTRKNLEAVVNDQIVEQLIDVNWPGTSEYAQFIMAAAAETEVSIKTPADVKVLKEASIIHPDTDLADKNAMRKIYNLPPLEALPEKQIQPVPSPVPPANNQPIKDENGDAPNGDGDAALSAPSSYDDEQAAYDDCCGGSINMATPDKTTDLPADLDKRFEKRAVKTNIPKLKKQMEDSDAALVDQLSANYTAIRDDMMAQTEKLLNEKQGTVDATKLRNMKVKGTLSRRVENTLIAHFVPLIEVQYVQAVGEIEESPVIPDEAQLVANLLALMESDHSVMLAVISTGEVAAPAAEVEQLKKWQAIGATEKIDRWREQRLHAFQKNWSQNKVFFISDVQDAEIVKKVKTAIQTGLNQNKSTAAIVADVKESLDPWVKTATGNAKLATPARLETIVRTNTTSLFADSRRLAFEDPLVTEAFPAMEFTAVLDNRTTDQCEGLDGAQYPVGDPIWNRITPPLHFNCRSTIVPVAAKEFDGRSRDPGALPALKDGKATGKTVLEATPQEFGGFKNAQAAAA